MEYQKKLTELGITLTKTGRQTCPKCSHTRQNKSEKCLSVKYDDNAVLYNCHHCGWTGSVSYRDKNEAQKSYKRPAMPNISTDKQYLYAYFNKRDISPNTLKKYGIETNEKHQIIFQYYKNGELVNVKTRTNLQDGKKTFTQSLEAEKTLYGMDLVKDTDTLIWVEGEIDVLSPAEQGITSVSVPQGATENKLECIENCFDFISKFKTHIIAVDNDSAGDKLKDNLLNRLGRCNCKIVNWKQYKDANEALIAGENLKEFIANAEILIPDGIVNFYDSFDEIYQYNNEADNGYYLTGWMGLDRIIKPRKSYLMIVTGYPSRGKSTFVDNFTVNLSKKYGLKHLYASFECTTAHHYNTIAEMYAQKAIFKLKEEEKLLEKDIFEFVAEHFYRFDINRQWTIDEIIERTELAVRKYGIDTLIIDPYNRLNNNYTDREDKYVGQILSKLSMLAKKLNILVIFVAHPKKPDGEKMPNMYSISGSGDWYNMADYGIIVHRERINGELTNCPTIMVQKVKNHMLGRTSGGEVTLKYIPEKRILVDVNTYKGA